MIGLIFAHPYHKLLKMGTVDVKTAKKALESYIKGLMQDFINEYGMPIAQVQIDSQINTETNTRTITEVKVLTDMEVPLLNA